MVIFLHSSLFVEVRADFLGMLNVKTEKSVRRFRLFDDEFA